MGHTLTIAQQLIKTMFLDYQSLTVVILVDTFGLLLVAVEKDTIMDLIVLVLLIKHILFLLLTIIIIVNQLLGILLMVLLVPGLTSMTHYGTEKDV